MKYIKSYKLFESFFVDSFIEKFGTQDRLLKHYIELLNGMDFSFNVTGIRHRDYRDFNFDTSLMDGLLSIYKDNDIKITSYSPDSSVSDYIYIDEPTRIKDYSANDALEPENDDLSNDMSEAIFYLVRKINYFCGVFNIDRTELEERFEEFDILKENKIDIIRLNSLYDFYNKTFDEFIVTNLLKNNFSVLTKTNTGHLLT